MWDNKLSNKQRTVKKPEIEYLASKCNIPDKEVMLIRNNQLAVCPITTHISIKDVSKKF